MVVVVVVVVLVSRVVCLGVTERRREFRQPMRRDLTDAIGTDESRRVARSSGAQSRVLVRGQLVWLGASRSEVLWSRWRRCWLLKFGRGGGRCVGW